MAEAPKPPEKGPAQGQADPEWGDSLLAELEGGPGGGLGGEIPAGAATKVDLDTAGLDLDFGEEPAPEAPPGPKPAVEAAVSAPAEEEPDEPEPGRPRWFWPVVLGGGGGLLVGLLLVLTSLLGWWTGEKPSLPNQPAAAPAEELKPGDPLTADLEPFMVPLVDPEKTMLVVRINLAMNSQGGLSLLARQKTRVRDVVYQVLLEKGRGVLNKEESPQALRRAILAALNQKLEGEPVRQVYFLDFMIL